MAKPMAAPTKKLGQSAKTITTTAKQAKKFLTFLLLNFFWFSFPISYLDEEVFYQIHYLVFLFYFPLD